MEAALPAVLAMLLAAIVTLVFAFRAKRRLKTIQECSFAIGGQDSTCLLNNKSAESGPGE